jgi:hypothetical protein
VLPTSHRYNSRTGPVTPPAKPGAPAAPNPLYGPAPEALAKCSRPLMERRKISAGDIASRRIRRPCGFAWRYLTRRDEHMPLLMQLVQGQIGPVTFAEIGDGLASIDVSGRDPEWREMWAELIETIRRAA